MEWRLAGNLLEDGQKYQIKQRDFALELTIRDAVPEDSGVYTCVCREQKTKATVKVIGKPVIIVICITVYLCFTGIAGVLLSMYKQHLCFIEQRFLPHLK